MTCESIGNGFICTFTGGPELKFEFEGKETFMEWHKFCGPMFYTLDDDNYEVDLYPDDTERYTLLWEKFNEWFEENKNTEKTRTIFDD